MGIRVGCLPTNAIIRISQSIPLIVLLIIVILLFVVVLICSRGRYHPETNQYIGHGINNLGHLLDSMRKVQALDIFLLHLVTNLNFWLATDRNLGRWRV